MLQVRHGHLFANYPLICMISEGTLRVTIQNGPFADALPTRLKKSVLFCMDAETSGQTNPSHGTVIAPRAYI